MIDFDKHLVELRLAIHPNTHEVLAVEGPWQTLLGWTPAQYEQWVEASHPEERDRIGQLIRRACQGIHIRTKREQGGWCWLQWRSVLQDDAILCFATDQTHSQQTINRLRTSEFKYKQMVEYTADLWYLHDDKGNIVEANQAALNELGYSMEEMLALKVFEVETTVKAHSLTGIWNRMVPNQTVVVEGRQIRKDRTTFPVEVSLRKFDAGDKHLVSAVVRNASKTKIMEEHLSTLNAQLMGARDQALEASRLKSQFLASMSHELRTPLNAIIGYAELLEEEMIDDQLDEYVADVRHIHDASKYLLSLINDILDLSKIEAGKFEFLWAKCSIDELIQSVLDTIRPLAVAKALPLDVVVAPNISMETDRGRLTQVLLNLLSNAIKFTQEGKVSLNISADESWVRFVVKDTGVGIAPEMLTALFDPFSQVGDHQQNQKGTGLGLTICQRLCHLMGGDIEVSSVLGEGSTFEVVLPIARVDASDAMSGRASKNLPDDAPVAIVVGEHSQTQEHIRVMLEQQGVRALQAMNNYEALARIRALKPTMIVVDVTHTRRCYTLVRELMIDPIISRLPVLLVAEQEPEVAALQFPELDAVYVPLQEELLAPVAEYMTRKIAGKVCIGDVDPIVREGIQRNVEAHGCVALNAPQWSVLWSRFEKQQPNALIVDATLDGFSWSDIETWRVPTLIITAEDDLDVPASCKSIVTGVVKKGNYTEGQFHALFRKTILSEIN